MSPALQMPAPHRMPITPARELEVRTLVGFSGITVIVSRGGVERARVEVEAECQPYRADDLLALVSPDVWSAAYLASEDPRATPQVTVVRAPQIDGTHPDARPRVHLVRTQ